MKEDKLNYYFHTYFGFRKLLFKAFPYRWNAQFNSKSNDEQLAIYEAHLTADVKYCTHYELKHGKFQDNRFKAFEQHHFNHPLYKGPVPVYHGSTVEAIFDIFENGFDKDKEGTYGKFCSGVYTTNDLETALLYSTPFCHGSIPDMQVAVWAGYAHVGNTDMTDDYAGHLLHIPVGQENQTAWGAKDNGEDVVALSNPERTIFCTKYNRVENEHEAQLMTVGRFLFSCNTNLYPSNFALLHMRWPIQLWNQSGHAVCFE